MSMSIDTGINNNLKTLQTQLSTGSRINSAADDPSGLAISEKMDAVLRGTQQGSENTAAMKDLVNTAEGALSTIADSLQRIRELSLQASNGTLDKSDKDIIQNEIKQLLEGIDQTAKTAEFNKQKLLDGSFKDKNTASYQDGTGKQISIPDMSLESLGLKDFDVTGDFDLNKIDQAMETVNATRSQLGATSNTFDHVISSNSITELNMAASKSRIADADMAKASMDYNKNKLLLDYQILASKRQQEAEKNKLTILG